MKKTVSVSIASTPFLLEEDAYRALDAYLAGVKSHFAGAPEEAEIVADIESRIAEQFAEAARKVIDLATVEGVIASMGDAREFGEGGSKAGTPPGPEAPKPQDAPKRLYRNPEDKVIAGVASGVAAYLGVDAVVVRVAFIVLTLLNGFGILLYVALWISMPEARTASQRLEMSGTPVTLENLADRVKERVEEMKKDEGVWRRLVTLPFLAVGGVFAFLTRRVFPLLGRLLGFCVIVGSVLGLFALSVGFGLLLTRVDLHQLGFPGAEAVSPMMALLGAVAGYLAIAIPLLGLLSVGAALTGRKPAVGRSVSGALAAVWFLAMAAGTVIALTSGMAVAERAADDPRYRVQTRSVEAAPFGAIRALDGARVSYVESATASVTLEGRPYDMERLRVGVVDGTLTVETSPALRPCFLCNFRMPRVVVSGPGVNRFEVRNGSRLEAAGLRSAEIAVSDGSRGTFQIEGGSVSAQVADAGRLELSGTVERAELKATDGSRLEAESLEAYAASVTADNGSRAAIGPTKELEARASDGSRIDYAGMPKLTRQADDGSRVAPLAEEEFETER